eukprot:TRINITY_DN20165_c0_g1_i2.p1 TRINITY_DN20165_c0_g1~~TRINITY_DN20165_c0_g1_i2.p1  ORF type:complete len:278 (+),score=51.84 TRINITY_DN20165_c0_g1_i2:163-996(+)
MVEQRSQKAGDIFNAINRSSGQTHELKGAEAEDAAPLRSKGFSSSLRSEVRRTQHSRSASSKPPTLASAARRSQISSHAPSARRSQVDTEPPVTRSNDAPESAPDTVDDPDAMFYDPAYVQSQRKVTAEQTEEQYTKLKAKLAAARARLDDMSNETNEQHSQMNHIESEFGWWTDKMRSVDCDEDWAEEMPSWDDVYTKICRPGTASAPSKTPRPSTKPEQLQEGAVTTFSSNTTVMTVNIGSPCGPSIKKTTTKASPRSKRATLAQAKQRAPKSSN